MAANGEIQWPPMGSFPWPLSLPQADSSGHANASSGRGCSVAIGIARRTAELASPFVALQSRAAWMRGRSRRRLTRSRTARRREDEAIVSTAGAGRFRLGRTQKPGAAQIGLDRRDRYVGELAYRPPWQQGSRVRWHRCAAGQSLLPRAYST
jgi:hypothetical protein